MQQRMEEMKVWKEKEERNLGRIDFGEIFDDGEDSLDDLLFGDMIVAV